MIITSVGLLVVALVLLLVGIVKSGVSYLVLSAIATLAAGVVLYASFVYYRNKAVTEGRLQVGPDGAVITPGYPTAYAGGTSVHANGSGPAPSITAAFEGLDAKQTAELAATLNLDELHVLRRFEVEGENRKAVLRAIDGRVDSIVSTRRSLSGSS
jgi:hypothetical protein